MPSLIARRGKRRWRAAVMVNGVSRMKWFPDASKASERAAILWEAEERSRLEAELAKQEQESTIPMVCGLGAWANAYLSHAQTRLAPKTWKEKRQCFGFLARDYGPETGVDIVAEQAEAYLEGQARRRSGNAANKDRKNLATAWDFGARRLDGFPQVPNPFRAVERFAEERQPRYVPPEDDFWKVYATAQSQQDQLMLLAYLHTAARRGEIFRLTWPDIDFAEGTIRLWTRKRKGGLESDLLPLTGELKAGLLSWWEKRPVKDTSNVFVCLERIACNGKHYGQPFSYRLEWMRTLCDRAGVKRFGLHAIRHLTAVSLYKAGYPLATIQTILRHRRATTTEVYLRSMGLNLEGARDALESLASRGLGKVVHLRPSKRAAQ